MENLLPSVVGISADIATISRLLETLRLRRGIEVRRFEVEPNDHDLGFLSGRFVITARRSIVLEAALVGAVDIGGGHWHLHSVEEIAAAGTSRGYTREEIALLVEEAKRK